MRQWEYKVVYISLSQSAEDRLNEAGERGWELVAVKENRYIFKRPVPIEPDNE